MSQIKYLKFNEIDPNQFIPILNENSIREHLIHYDQFDSQSIHEWVKGKVEEDSIPGCRVRAVLVDNALMGWCGIQKEEKHFEIAIVIAQSAWGIGLSIYRDMMGWVKELQHEEVVIHLLESRPEYEFLKRKSSKTYETNMLGRTFRTYHLRVE